jgi:hypothetical protein
MSLRVPITAVALIAVAAASVTFAGSPSSAAASHPRVVAVTYSYEYGFINPCGFRTVSATVRQRPQPELLRRINLLLPRQLPGPGVGKYMADLPRESLVLTMAGGKRDVYSATAEELPATLHRVITLMRGQLRGPCTAALRG